MAVVSKQTQTIGEPKAFIQLWNQKTVGSPETERGFSLHLTEVDARAYVRNYWTSQPDLGPMQAPERYISDCFEPLEISIPNELYEELLAAKGRGELGIRKEYESPPPPIPREFTTLTSWDPDFLRMAMTGNR